MSHNIPTSTNSFHSTGRIMTSEEFEQVIGAIVAGRYSWACVLILRISGYNPLHYLPYRTYRRLIKENSQPAFNQLSHQANYSIETQDKSTSEVT
jgi:hypothetical protein